MNFLLAINFLFDILFDMYDIYWDPSFNSFEVTQMIIILLV